MVHADDSQRASKDQIADFNNLPPMPFAKWPDFNSFLFFSFEDEYNIGWEQDSARKGGASFVITRRTWWAFKTVERYPFTEEGWNEAWQAFAALDPDTAKKIRTKLALREKKNMPWRELENDTLAYLENVIFLGGYSSFGDMKAGAIYDLRFLGSHLGIFHPGEIQTLGELRYDDFTDVQIGGPGLETSVNKLVDPAEKIAGGLIRLAQPGMNQSILNAEGAAISAVLKHLGTRTKIKTILFIQATGSELFFLNTRTEPSQLRIDLSRPLGEIRSVLSSSADDEKVSQDPKASLAINELYKAASLLDRGLITREDFNQLKSRLIDDS